MYLCIYLIALTVVQTSTLHRFEKFTPQVTSSPSRLNLVSTSVGRVPIFIDNSSNAKVAWVMFRVVGRAPRCFFACKKLWDSREP